MKISTTWSVSSRKLAAREEHDDVVRAGFTRQAHCDFCHRADFGGVATYCRRLATTPCPAGNARLRPDASSGYESFAEMASRDSAASGGGHDRRTIAGIIASIPRRKNGSRGWIAVLRTTGSAICGDHHYARRERDSSIETAASPGQRRNAAVIDLGVRLLHGRRLARCWAH